MECGHLPQHPAPHLADRLRDGTPLPRRTWPRPSPGDQGKDRLYGDHRRQPGPYRQHLRHTCHAINGVSKLHSEIIKDSVFHDYFLYKPQAFKNVTNGIAYRRWLLCSNPGLTHLLEEYHR